MISLSHVTKRYPGGLEALRNVTLTVEAGEIVFITGPSGAGKSTLLKLMAAIERPTAGSVVVSGQNVGALRPRLVPFLRRKLGLIFQDQKLLFDRSAFDNVMLPLAVTGFERREAARRVRAALDKVGLLAKEKVHPIRLSGGEQQRLAIARAIVARPQILILDEATSNLDTESEQLIQASMASLFAGRTTFVIAHRLSTIRRADIILLMEEGRIVERGTHDELMRARGAYH
ncbi:MAG: cell division ATP-binding protein FtsE, partial [Burkholderiales bacterium]